MSYRGFTLKNYSLSVSHLYNIKLFLLYTYMAVSQNSELPFLWLQEYYFTDRCTAPILLSDPFKLADIFLNIARIYYTQWRKQVSLSGRRVQSPIATYSSTLPGRGILKFQLSKTRIPAFWYNMYTFLSSNCDIVCQLSTHFFCPHSLSLSPSLSWHGIT